MPAPAESTIARPDHARATRRGSAVMILLATVAGGSAIVFAVLSLSSHARLYPAPIAASRPTPATTAEVSSLLYRLGLSPERLAAAGIAGQQTTALIDNLRGYLDSNIDALRAADSGYASASVMVDSLERTVRAGTASREEKEALTSARALRASQASSRQTLLDAAFVAATAGLDGGVVQALTLASAGARWDLPLPYAFAERDQTDWVNLRDALANQRINTRHGLDPSQEALAVIADADAVPAISSARANLDANLAAVTAAWNAAINR